jgi:hypothetical protein
MQSLCLLLLLLLHPLLPVPNQTHPALPFENGGKEKVMDTARSYIGTIEKTNHNDGPIVEMFLKSVGRKKGDSWCAAFVSYCLKAGKATYPRIHSGLARAFKIKNSIKAYDALIGKYKILPGTIVVWEKGQTIFGHVGFVERWDKKSGITIEGNTPKDIAHSARKKNMKNIEGVFKKNRTIEPGNYFRITCFTQVQSAKVKVQKTKKQ